MNPQEKVLEYLKLNGIPFSYTTVSYTHLRAHETS